MKAKAALEISCADKRAREGLVAVLTPDNEGGPRGLGIELSGRGSRLSIRVEAATPATAMSTCLAFLNDIALFQEIWLLSQQVRG
ncbi:MAG: hypothetical protein JRM99_02185 [Nitrososphaerota archaeon]|nr:hypothetical protein [Nitrososphaerota archaeon]MDG6990211.1 hypothetical protein [Nitrososphaerota archaeon]